MTDNPAHQLRDYATLCWCYEKSADEPLDAPFFRCDECTVRLNAAAELDRLHALVDDVAARTEFFINPVVSLFDAHGEELVSPNTGVDDRIWVELPTELFDVLRVRHKHVRGW